MNSSSSSLILNMQPTKFALLLVVGLCATQSLASPISDLEDALKDIVQKVEDAANEFEKNAWKLIDEIKNNLNNIPKCMESEKPKVTALVNEVEQEAMQCITQAMSDVQPESEKIGKIINEVIPLVRTVVPALMKCEEDNQNPITLTICVVRVVGPVTGQVTQIINEVRNEIPELQKLVQDKIIPLFQQCSAKVQDETKKVQDIVADLEKCVENSQS